MSNINHGNHKAKKAQVAHAAKNVKTFEDALKLSKAEKEIDKVLELEAKKLKLIGIIGDEDTVVGFLLAGLGEVNHLQDPNFKIINKETPIEELEDSFRNFMHREDIEVVFLARKHADRISHLVEQYQSSSAAIVLIPSKDDPYDPNKDIVLTRAMGMFAPEDVLAICEGPYSKTLNPNL